MARRQSAMGAGCRLGYWAGQAVGRLVRVRRRTEGAYLRVCSRRGRSLEELRRWKGALFGLEQWSSHVRGERMEALSWLGRARARCRGRLGRCWFVKKECVELEVLVAREVSKERWAEAE